MKSYSLEFLNKKADAMFTYLCTQPPTMDNEDAVVERLMQLGRMIAESGNYKSFALFKVDEILNGEIRKSIDEEYIDKLNITTLNKYLKSACKEWNYLVNSFDRINSAASKQQLSLHTLISYEKAKMGIR